MRIAVSLPCLSPRAVERNQLESSIRALADLAEVEVFAESLRLREGDLPARGFHYLRLPERHSAAPFDAALHPVGRDFWPYEAPVLLAQKMPSVTWLLDTVGHHVLIGAFIGHGRWDRYVARLEKQDARGVAAAITVARGWGTRALFRTRDPLPALLAGDNWLVAASATRRFHLDEEPSLAPLPNTAAELQPPAFVAGNVRSIAVVAPNLSWPLPELRSLAAVLAVRPDLRVTYHTINVFEPGLRHAAAGLGIEERVEWIIDGGVDRRRDMADDADVVVMMTGDPTLNDQSLVQRAMAAGQVVVVARTPVWEELPAGSAIVVDAGREREAGLREALLELAADPQLAAGVGAVAARSGSDVTASATAETLLNKLRARAAAGPVEIQRTATAAFAQARGFMVGYCSPHNASAAARALVAERIDNVLPDPRGPVAWRPQ